MPCCPVRCWPSGRASGSASASHYVPGARYLAVLVAYRDIYRARWRAVVSLPANSDADGDSDWLLTLDADKVTVAPHDAKGDKGSWKEGGHVLER